MESHSAIVVPWCLDPQTAKSSWSIDQLQLCQSGCLLNFLALWPVPEGPVTSFTTLPSRNVYIVSSSSRGRNTIISRLSVSSVQSISPVRLFATPWIAARQASLSITNSRSLLKLMPIESVMPFSHLILCIPFSSCSESLPASGFFPMSQFFTWGGQSTGVLASASVLPMNTQDGSPLRWTGWIGL